MGTGRGITGPGVTAGLRIGTTVATGGADGIGNGRGITGGTGGSTGLGIGTTVATGGAGGSGNGRGITGPGGTIGLGIGSTVAGLTSGTGA